MSNSEDSHTLLGYYRFRKDPVVSKCANHFVSRLAYDNPTDVDFKIPSNNGILFRKDCEQTRKHLNHVIVGGP
jgi:hypothetical protein